MTLPTTPVGDGVYTAVFDTIVSDTTSASLDELAARIGDAVAQVVPVDAATATSCALARLVERVATPEQVAAAVAADLA